MATLLLIGQIYEVDATEYEDKKTGKVKYGTEVQIEFEGLTDEGKRRKTVESISLDEEYFDVLHNKIGKYAAIHYISKNDQYGLKLYPDKKMPVLTFDTNPLDYSPFIKQSVSPKAPKA